MKTTKLDSDAPHRTAFITPKHTRSNQSKLVFLISVLLFFNISSWEEKSHHSFEELVHELDGERHHVHLEKNKTTIITIKTRKKTLFKKVLQVFTSKCSFTEMPPTGGRTLLKIRKANWRPNWQLL